MASNQVCSMGNGLITWRFTCSNNCFCAQDKQEREKMKWGWWCCATALCMQEFQTTCARSEIAINIRLTCKSLQAPSSCFSLWGRIQCFITFLHSSLFNLSSWMTFQRTSLLLKSRGIVHSQKSHILLLASDDIQLISSPSTSLQELFVRLHLPAFVLFLWRRKDIMLPAHVEYVLLTMCVCLIHCSHVNTCKVLCNCSQWGNTKWFRNCYFNSGAYQQWCHWKCTEQQKY